MRQLTETYSIEVIVGQPNLKQMLDLTYLSEMAVEQSGFKDWSYNRDKMVQVLQVGASETQLLALLHDKEEAVGILYAVTESYPFSDDITAREFLWFTNNDRKASLLLYKTYMTWCKAMGVDQIMIGVHGGLSQDDKFLKRQGFTPLETQYILKGS